MTRKELDAERFPRADLSWAEKVRRLIVRGSVLRSESLAS